MNDNFDIAKLEGVKHGQMVVLMHSMLPALRCAKAHLHRHMGRKHEEEITGLAYWIEQIEEELNLVK